MIIFSKRLRQEEFLWRPENRSWLKIIHSMEWEWQESIFPMMHKAGMSQVRQEMWRSETIHLPEEKHRQFMWIRQIRMYRQRRRYMKIWRLKEIHSIWKTRVYWMQKVSRIWPLKTIRSIVRIHQWHWLQVPRIHSLLWENLKKFLWRQMERNRIRICISSTDVKMSYLKIIVMTAVWIWKQRFRIWMHLKSSSKGIILPSTAAEIWQRQQEISIMFPAMRIFWKFQIQELWRQSEKELHLFVLLQYQAAENTKEIPLNLQSAEVWKVCFRQDWRLMQKKNRFR